MNKFAECISKRIGLLIDMGEMKERNIGEL